MRVQTGWALLEGRATGMTPSQVSQRRPDGDVVTGRQVKR